MTVRLSVSVVRPSLLTLGLLLAAGSQYNGIVERAMPAPIRSLVHWLLNYVPDFSRLNLTNRYTDSDHRTDNSSRCSRCRGRD